MDDKIIKIARFGDYIQANMAKISLEAEGIQCFLGGENFVATYGLFSNAIGTIELCIKESDKQQAEEILRESASNSCEEQISDDEDEPPATD
jgi:hypothetical protein